MDLGVPDRCGAIDREEVGRVCIGDDLGDVRMPRHIVVSVGDSESRRNPACAELMQLDVQAQDVGCVGRVRFPDLHAYPAGLPSPQGTDPGRVWARATRFNEPVLLGDAPRRDVVFGGDQNQFVQLRATRDVRDQEAERRAPEAASTEPWLEERIPDQRAVRTLRAYVVKEDLPDELVVSHDREVPNSMTLDALGEVVPRGGRLSVPWRATHLRFIELRQANVRGHGPHPYHTGRL